VPPAATFPQIRLAPGQFRPRPGRDRVVPAGLAGILAEFLPLTEILTVRRRKGARPCPASDLPDHLPPASRQAGGVPGHVCGKQGQGRNGACRRCQRPAGLRAAGFRAMSAASRVRTEPAANASGLPASGRRPSGPCLRIAGSERRLPQMPAACRLPGGGLPCHVCGKQGQNGACRQCQWPAGFRAAAFRACLRQARSERSLPPVTGAWRLPGGGQKGREAAFRFMADDLARQQGDWSRSWSKAGVQGAGLRWPEPLPDGEWCAGSRTEVAGAVAGARGNSESNW
jgi:hypothetical protein